MSLAFSGIGVSRGIAVGRVHRLTAGQPSVAEYHLEPGDIEQELERLDSAVDRGDRFLTELMARSEGEGGDTARELLEAHRLILRDPMLLDGAREAVSEQRINAEWALARQREQLIDEFRKIDDEYIALRQEDLDQVVKLILRELAEQPGSLLTAKTPHRLNEVIIVAGELGPAEMAVLHQRRVGGLVTEHGGPMSHAAILARSLEIPMVVGVHRAVSLLREDETLILDGHYGSLICSHSEPLQRHYEDKREVIQRRRADLGRYISRPSRTADGQGFQLYGNAELPQEFERCREVRVAGIGLMRTEYLFLDGTIPDEETQFRAYRAALKQMDGRPVTVRTLDAGGDKLPPAMALSEGPNPALGLRGLRLSLAMPDSFRDQINAILRASVQGPIEILLPMITSLNEVRQARALIEDCRLTLRRQGLAIDPDIPIGGMIETPAAALSLDALAAELDFLSIGTNDLVQYTLAVDRQDELVSYLHDPAHPAVLRLLAEIVEQGQRHQRPVTVCGELAGDERAARLLLGLGVRRFSLPPSALPAVKKSLIEADSRRCRELVETWRSQSSDADSQRLLADLMRD